MNHYEELGLDPRASEEEIRRAYRRLVKLVHPDQQLDPEVRLLAEKQMIRLNAIAQTLLDPLRRREYDFQVFGIGPHARPRRTAAATPPAWTPTAPEQPKTTRSRKLGLYGSIAAVGIAAVLLWSWTVSSSATDVRGRPPNAAGDTFRAAQQHPLSGYPAQTAGRPGAAAPSLASGVSDADTEAAYRAEFGNSGASASGTASEVHAHGQKPAAKPSGRSVLVVGLVTPTGNPSGPPSVPPPPDTALNSAGPDNNAAVAPEGLQTVPVAPSLPNTLPTQVQQPILVSRVQPAYPPLAKSVRLQGTVEFIATVGRDGAVKSVQLIRGPQLLVDAARDAVMRWRYRPSTVNGVPMEARTKVSVIFQLD